MEFLQMSKIGQTCLFSSHLSIFQLQLRTLLRHWDAPFNFIIREKTNKQKRINLNINDILSTIKNIFSQIQNQRLVFDFSICRLI